MGSLVGGAAVCAGALVGHAWSYLPYFPDDSYISLRYAKRLAEGHGLTWTDGERVEGYTNLLWVLLTSALGALHLDWVRAARAAGAASLVSVILALFLFFYGHQPRKRAAIVPPLFGGLVLALAGPVGAYAMAGLEHPFSAALLAWGILLVDRERAREQPGMRRLWLPGLLLGLCSLARADAIVLVAGLVLGVLAARGATRAALATALRLSALPAALFAAGIAFQRLYYGAWVPNTYHAKVAFTAARLRHGVHYFGESALRVAPLGLVLALALHAAVVDRELRARLALPATPLLLWCAYVVLVGGDNMELGRHFVPAVVLAAIVTTMVTGWALDHGPRLRAAAFAGGPLLLAALAASSLLDPRRTMARGRPWDWAGEPVGLLLRRAFASERPLVAVDAAGALPFYAELPALDMLGLNDRYLALHPPPTFGKGKLAHELGDGRYVLSRKPDIVVFGTPLGGAKPAFRGDVELEREPDFRRLYRLITFESRRPTAEARLWVRAEDGAIGVRRGPGRIVVPGFLLAGSGCVARLDARGRLGAYVTPKRAGSFELAVPAGRWAAHVDADGPVRVSLESAGTAPLAGVREAAFATFASDAPSVDVVIRVEAARPVHVVQIALDRG